LDEATAKVERFLEGVKRYYRLERAILFGSRARGDHLKHSDTDILLVSDDFEGICFPQRPTKLYAFWEGGMGLELLCYTLKEFKRKCRRIGVVKEAVKEGINLLGHM